MKTNTQTLEKTLTWWVSKLRRQSERRTLQISGNEMMLITDIRLGCMPGYATAICLGSSVAESESDFAYGEKWGVNVLRLAAKLELAPLSILVEILADIEEAWAFHNTTATGSAFARFLKGRCYRFRAIPEGERIREGRCLVGATLADGSIVVGRVPTHVSRTDKVTVGLALERLDPCGREFIEEEVSVKESIGNTQCVRTVDGDGIVFARRPGRKGLTRFVKNREPEDCDSVFVVLKKVRQHRYVLLTGFTGCKPEPEPWDEQAFSRAKDPAEARKRSQEFWNQHALVYHESDIVPGSELPEEKIPSKSAQEPQM